MCGIFSFTEHFESADYVAVGKIIKVYPNVSDEEIYKADIQVFNLIKGPKISSIYVYGRSDGKIGGSCSIYTPEGKDYIFLQKRIMMDFSYLESVLAQGILIMSKKKQPISWRLWRF